MLSTTPVGDRTDIVVVTHDGAAWIGECLRSLAASGAPLERVSVVDNASGDDTLHLLAREFPEVRVLPLATNIGYGAAVNLALSTSTSEYVVVLNQDVTSGPGWIERLVAALDADSRAGLATPMVLLRCDPTRVNACGNDIHLTGLVPCRGYFSLAEEWTGTHRVTAVSGAAFVIRRSLALRLGGFDPLFFMYVEDADISLRAALAGASSICVPEAVVVHDFVPTFSGQKIHWLERNRALMLLRSLHGRTLLLLAPALALTELLVLGYAATRGPATLAGKVAAYRWLIRSAGPIRASRRRTQRLRRVGDAQLLTLFVGRLDVSELDGRAPRLVAATVNPLFAAWLAVLRRIVRW